MTSLASAFSRHIRFYIALLCGTAAYGIAVGLRLDAAFLAAGDAFYAVFLGLCAVMGAGQTPADLKRRAKTEDEGIAIVVLITLATMAYFAVAVFIALGRKHALDIPALSMAAGGALLG